MDQPDYKIHVPKQGRKRGRKPLTTVAFVNKAKKVHGPTKYGYELVKYKRSNIGVDIICHVEGHGVFNQHPNHHLKGHGCPKCANETKGYGVTTFTSFCVKNNNGYGTLYILKCYNNTETFYKIGVTSRTVAERFCRTRYMPYSYEPLVEIVAQAGRIYRFEAQLLAHHRQYRYSPDIPFCGSVRECFSELTGAVKSLLLGK